MNLEIVHITRTYLGLLEGTPTADLNDEIIAGAEKEAGALALSSPVFVAPPLRTVDQRPSGFLRTLPRRSGELLPPFLCVGHFVSHAPKDPEYDGSSLTLVWFQAESPLLHGIHPPLDELEWSAKARDFYH